MTLPCPLLGGLPPLTCPLTGCMSNLAGSCIVREPTEGDAAYTAELYHVEPQDVEEQAARIQLAITADLWFEYVTGKPITKGLPVNFEEALDPRQEPSFHQWNTTPATWVSVTTLISSLQKRIHP